MDLRSIKMLEPLDQERLLFYGMTQAIQVADMLKQISDESNMDFARICVMGYQFQNEDQTARIFHGCYCKGEQIVTNILPTGTEGPLAGPRPPAPAEDDPIEQPPVVLKFYIIKQVFGFGTFRFINDIAPGLSNQEILDGAVALSKGNAGQHVIIGANFNPNHTDDTNQILRAFCFGGRLLDHNMDVSLTGLP